MPRFTPDSIMGLIWKETWDKLELSTKEPDEIQKEYVNFVRKYKITAPCWVPIEPYPVPPDEKTLDNSNNAEHSSSAQLAE